MGVVLSCFDFGNSFEDDERGFEFIPLRSSSDKRDYEAEVDYNTGQLNSFVGL